MIKVSKLKNKGFKLIVISRLLFVKKDKSGPEIRLIINKLTKSKREHSLMLITLR